MESHYQIKNYKINPSLPFTIFSGKVEFFMEINSLNKGVSMIKLNRLLKSKTEYDRKN